jgi:hypothetical protein
MDDKPDRFPKMIIGKDKIEGNKFSHIAFWTVGLIGRAHSQLAKTY